MVKKNTLIFLLIIIPLFAFAQEIGEQDAFLVAKNAYDKESYGVALDLFNRFIEKFPNSQAIYEAQLYLAECLFQEERFIQARDTLTKLEKTNLAYGIEDRFLFLLGEVYLKVKDFSQAQSYFKKLIETHPDSDLFIDAEMQLGLSFFYDDKYQEASDIFDALTKSGDLSVQEEAFFRKGEALYNMKDYKSVLDNYSTFTKIFWESDKLAKAYFYMGEASFYSEDFVKAAEYYSSAWEKSDDDSLKIISLQGAGWSYIKQNKLNDAEEAFSKIDEFPDQDFNKESLFLGKATLYYQLGKLEKAIIYYDRLIGSYPHSDTVLSALFGKAECLSGLSNFKEAIDAYKEFISQVSQKNNSNIQGMMDKVYYNLGWAYFKTGDLSSAVTEFQKAVSLSKDNEVKLSALYQIGDIYQNNLEFDKAEEVYSRILKDYPDNSYSDYVLYQLGLTRFKSDKIDAAILSFRDFNENFTQSDLLDDVNYYLGYAYFRKSDMENTCVQLQRFLDAFPNSVYRDMAIYLLATSFYSRGMFKEALDNFQNILKEFRQNKELVQKAEYEIASTLYQMGDEKSAINKFRQFIEDYPKSEITPDVIFWLGQFYYQNLEYELSRRNFETIIRMYPTHKLAQEAKYQIGLIFLAEGKSENAMHTFKRLIEECDSQQIKLKSMLAVADLLAEQDQEAQAIQMYKDLIALASSSNESTDSSIKNQADENNRSIELNKFLDYTSEIRETKEKSTDQGSGANSIDNVIKTAYINLADLYKINKNFSDAIYSYREAIKYSPGESSSELQFKIAECLEEGKDFVAAIEEYLKIPYISEQDKPWVIKGMLRSARIYEDKEDWQKAKEIYQKIVNYNVPESKYAEDKIDQMKTQFME